MVHWCGLLVYCRGPLVDWCGSLVYRFGSTGRLVSLTACSPGSGAEVGTIGGIVSAVAMALVGAVTSYISYQKKKLCFGIQREEPSGLKLSLTLSQEA